MNFLQDVGPLQGVGPSSVSRREALALLGAALAVRSAGAAEPGIMQPVSLDHVNIRVSNVGATGKFYMGLLETPVLWTPALRAQPGGAASESFFLKFGDGYLAISQAFAPDLPGLDHYSLGLRDYDKARLEAKLKDGGIAAQARPSSDIWLGDLDGSLMQLRAPGGWARQTAKPYQLPVGPKPPLSPLSISRIALLCADLAHAGDYYGRLFGTEISSAASSRSRAIGLGDSVLELIAAPANSAPAGHLGMDHLRIAIKDFNADTVGRALRERGIETSAADGVVRLADPDGIRIELAAAS
jgi:catechol 2,3-dioxygenase-like lactoylglutathione lyase family enzyme